MMLITIDEHPLRSDAFDKFLAGMAIEAECRAAIHRADYAHRLTCRFARNTVSHAAIALNVSQEGPRRRRLRPTAAGTSAMTARPR